MQNGTKTHVFNIPFHFFYHEDMDNENIIIIKMGDDFNISNYTGILKKNEKDNKYYEDISSKILENIDFINKDMNNRILFTTKQSNAKDKKDIKVKGIYSFYRYDIADDINDVDSKKNYKFLNIKNDKGNYEPLNKWDFINKTKKEYEDELYNQVEKIEFHIIKNKYIISDNSILTRNPTEPDRKHYSFIIDLKQKTDIHVIRIKKSDQSSYLLQF
jgi:hypothetical protein